MYPGHCGQGWLGGKCLNGCGNANHLGFRCSPHGHAGIPGHTGTAAPPPPPSPPKPPPPPSPPPPPEEDPYEVLGVAMDATSAEIRKAFRALSLKWHPDKNTGADQAEATAKFSSIGAAYEKIGTPDARAMFDDFGEDPGGFDTYVRRHSVSLWPVRLLVACVHAAAK